MNIIKRFSKNGELKEIETKHINNNYGQYIYLSR